MDQNFLDIGHENSYTNIENMFKTNYQPNIIEQPEGTPIQNTPTYYSILTYIPSAIGIIIAKSLHGCMADIYFTGRLFSLIAFAGMMVLTLKILPYKKKTFFVVATLPITLLLSTVYSADMLCIGFSFIFMAYCLRLLRKKHVGVKQLLILIALFALLCFPKSMSYIFIAFIVFSLPIKKIFIENKKYIGYLIAVFIVICGFIVYNGLHKDIPDDPRGGNTGQGEQLGFLIQNPSMIFVVGKNHVLQSVADFTWLSGLHLDYYFGKTSKNVFLFMLMYVLYVSLIDTSKVYSIKEKIIFILGFLITYGATSAMLYLTFTEIGKDVVNGYQSRYILPILPLLLISVANKTVRVRRKENMNRNIAYVATVFLLLGVFGTIFAP